MTQPFSLSMLTTLWLSLCLSNAQAAAAPLAVQPYLQNPEPTAMTVIWWTVDSRPKSSVELSPASATPHRRAKARLVAASNTWSAGFSLYRHEARIDGLQPGTSYRYRVRSGRVVSDPATLHTAPDRSADVRIAFLGDGRTDSPQILASHRLVLDQAADADLVVELGDTVYDANTDQWMAYLTQVLSAGPDEPLGPGSHLPSLHVVGNHEIALLPQDIDSPTDAQVYGDGYTAVARFQDALAHPDNASSNPAWAERYYAVDYGPVTLIALDLNNTSDDALDNHDFLPDGSTPDWQPGSEQYNWLVAQLQAAHARSALTIVMAHPSPYSSGVHGTDDPAIDQQRGHELRVLLPTLLTYGVDALVTSHDHLAEAGLVGPPGFEAKMDPQDPANMLFFVMGDSGANSRPPDDAWQSWMSINDNGQAPFYRTWIYDWAGSDDQRSPYSSHLELKVDRLERGGIAATFAVVRTDGQRFAEVRLERDLPDID